MTAKSRGGFWSLPTTTGKGSRRSSILAFWPAPIGNWERISISRHSVIAPRTTKPMAESRCTWSVKCAQTVHLDSQEFRFEEGEYITTEHSYKYTLPGFAGLALRAGFELVRNWEDRNHLFSVLFLRVRDGKPGPKRISPGFDGTPGKACEAWR